MAGLSTTPPALDPGTTRAPLFLRSVYLKSLRDHRHGLLGWSAGLALLVLTESLIWPSFRDVPDLERLFAQYPDYLQRLFDVSAMTSGRGFINAELYTLLLPALFLVHAIGRGARLVAGEEESGTLDVLLVTPLSTRRILLEKALALVSTVLLLGLALYVATLGCSWAIGLGIGPVDTLEGCLAMVLLGSEFGLLALGVGAATGRRSLAVAVPAAAAVAAYVLYVAGLVVEGVDPWQHLSPMEQALASGPLGGGLPLDFLWLALGSLLLLLLTLPALDRRDIAAPG
ncbi:ABC transporter permease subunit [Nocardioides panaciterrulae]|uniref:ABC-2 type transport system permease protein n=1 Tax=Nocardioides panaciterrulae TaxID=661492 RepID=A0A7Y9E9W5_9ACTN|nr:ABC-2 type transport system permease protein [Nocardioides panaciterrulae]